MILTIMCVWMLLTYPLVRDTLKYMEQQNLPERDSVLFQIVLIIQSMIKLPIYYYLVTMNFLVKLIKRK